MISNYISNNFDLEKGTSLQNADPVEVFDFIKERKVIHHFVAPSQLRIIHIGKKLFLEIYTEKIKQYPLRRSFFEKLLMWYRFPSSTAYKLDLEVVVSILNNFLKINRRDYVRVAIENGEALTITSPDYMDIKDVDILEKLTLNEIEKITRTDMFTKIDLNELTTMNPLPNDTCGMGLTIFNSETGFHNFEVQMYHFRYICSNGAIMSTNIFDKSITHYKRNINDINYQLLISNGLKIYMDKIELIQMQFEKAAGLNISTDKTREVSKKIDLVLGYKKSYSFFSEFKRDRKVDSSLFEVFNFITDKAKQYDPNIRMKLEKVAGKIILN